MPQPTDLFISEYVEGTSNNKAIEIYNGTGAAIDLVAGNYALRVSFNGGTSVQTVLLTGVIAAGATFVIANPSAGAAILAVDNQTSSVISFNGDDAVILLKNNVAIDVIGQIGTDPGTEWGTGLGSTADNTLVRNASIFAGDADGANAFDPSLEWTGFATDTFAGLGSHTIDNGTPTQTISIAPLSADKAEGDSGFTSFTFTISRTGATTGEATVSFSVAGGGANPADAGDFGGAFPSGVATLAIGQSSTTITVDVAADLAAEQSETFAVALSGQSAGYDLGAATATGTIRNDDFQEFAIYELQGAAHISPLLSSPTDRLGVTTRGVVTAVGANGFYIQDAEGDSSIATSDGILVFTGGAPTVSVGDDVRVTGTLSEFRPGGSSTNLTVTQISSNAAVASLTITTLGTAALPAATLIGDAGRIPPIQVIEDDAFASFDPATDGIDFYESLEGMLVGLQGAVSVGPTVRFTNSSDEIWLTTTTDAASGNSIGGVTITPGDFNPQRVQIDDLVNSMDMPSVNVGATFGFISGVVNYDFGNYEVLVSTAPTVLTDDLERETTTIEANASTLTIGSMNVENLDANDLDEKFAGLAEQIADNMKAPTIIALQEMQDNNGAINDGTTDASLTAAKLIAAIEAAGGPTYTYIDVAPANNTSGGEPGGNIRTAYLYRADVVSIGAVTSLADTDLSNGDAFAASRRPLVAEFTFRGESFVFINNHFSSKGGDQPLFGSTQPPVLSSETQRIAQAQVVNDYVDGLLAVDPNTKIVVLGDLNDFPWSKPLQTLDGSLGGEKILFNLAEEAIADPAERFSYVFEGNSQELDHIYLSQAALGVLGAFDIVHVNAAFHDQISDHDPSVASFTVNQAPVAGNDAAGADEDTPVTIDVLVNDEDADGDALTIVAAGPGAPSAAHGTVAIVDGKLVYTPDENYNGTDQISYSVTDGLATSGAVVDVAIAAINDNPVATNDGGFTTERGKTLTIPIATLLGNDTDVDGDTLSLTSVQASGGVQVSIVGPNVVFKPGNVVGPASFAYTIGDGHGGTATATASVEIDPYKTITGTSRSDFLWGTNQQDRMLGLGGNDFIYAAGADDILDGGDGNDALFGSLGADTLIGGRGNDTLFDWAGDNRFDGGAGADDLVSGNWLGRDVFVFRAGYGKDSISGFDRNDVIELDSALADTFAEVLALATKSRGGALLTFDSQTSLFIDNIKPRDLQADDFVFV